MRAKHRIWCHNFLDMSVGKVTSANGKPQWEFSNKPYGRKSIHVEVS